MTASRPLVIALAASAAVNVFLIGGLAGMTYVRLTAPPPAPVVKPAAAPAPTPVSPPRPATSTPVALPEASPKPARRVTSHPAPSPVVDPAPQPAIAPPSAEAATPAPARLPLISAGDGLSAESRQAFRKALGQANKMNRPLSQQARAERQAALSAMSAPGYDAGEVARRLSTARALDQQARGNVEAALAAFTATLSPAERAILADGLVRVYSPAAGRRGNMAGPN